MVVAEVLDEHLLFVRDPTGGRDKLLKRLEPPISAPLGSRDMIMPMLARANLRRVVAVCLAAGTGAVVGTEPSQTEPLRTPGEPVSAIVYHLVEGARYFDILIARIGRREYTVIGELDDMCLELPDQRDYDGDGASDALVRRTDACGSVAGPGPLFFVSGGDGFRQSNRFPGEHPNVEPWEGGWSVVTGSGRYLLREGRAVLVSR
mgnify:CR=1 FL=1